MLLPLDLEVTYDDGTKERMKLPIEIWRTNELSFTKGFFSDKGVTRVEIDPDEHYADVNPENDVWEASVLQSGEGTRR